MRKLLSILTCLAFAGIALAPVAAAQGAFGAAIGGTDDSVVVAATAEGAGGTRYTVLGDGRVVAVYEESNGCQWLQPEPTFCEGGWRDGDRRVTAVEDPVGIPEDVWGAAGETVRMVGALWRDLVAVLEDVYAAAVEFAGDAYAYGVCTAGRVWAALWGEPSVPCQFG